jgi:hypothetical protein
MRGSGTDTGVGALPGRFRRPAPSLVKLTFRERKPFGTGRYAAAPRSAFAKITPVIGLKVRVK